jgi:HK97 gp10 family phage protein
MADNIEFTISGLDDALKTLKRIPDDMKAKGIRFAGRRGAEVIHKAAVANAMRIDDPDTAQNIAKNIVVRFSNRRFKQSGDILFRVGVMGGARQYADTKENRRKRRVGSTFETAGDKGNPGGDTWYWRFIEFGTEHSAAKPFMRPALDQNIDSATNVFVRSLDKWLTSYLKKKPKGAK